MIPLNGNLPALLLLFLTFATAASPATAQTRKIVEYQNSIRSHVVESVAVLYDSIIEKCPPLPCCPPPPY